MFAPPPLQLSRAEIQTRLTGEKSTEINDPPKKGLGKSLSIHRREPRSPTSPRRFFFGKGDRALKSPPTADQLYQASPERAPRPPVDDNKIARTERERVINLPEGFGENPRPAPTPPKRSTPVPLLDTKWRPRVPGVFTLAPDSRSENLQGNGTPPPIPPKSHRRQKIAIDNLETSQTFGQQSSASIDSLRSATAPEDSNHEIDGMSENAISELQRASTSPDLVTQELLNPTAERVASLVRSSTWATYQTNGTNDTSFSRIVGTSSRWPEVSSFRVRKPLTGRRIRRGRSPLAAEMKSSHDTNREDQPLSTSTGPGLFQNGESARSYNVTWSLYGTEALDRLAFMDKPLPETPRSITLSPTEIIQSAQVSPLSRFRTLRMRSPLSQISPTHGKANSATFSEDGASPSRLSSIPEDTASNGKSPLALGSRPAWATRIHLRGGSLLTVSPPELTPWKPTIYIQGPIKLPNPVIVPRKNSVASLEPFQEAIDQVYQDALSIPRRRSDDKVLDDVCEFFDEFGFEEVSFEGDVLGTELLDVDNGMDMDFEKDIERFSTPPGESMATPVEKRVAQDIVEMMAGQQPLTDWKIPPGEKEDALQSKGISIRTSHSATKVNIASPNRRDSMTLPGFETGTNPLLSKAKQPMRNNAQEHFGNEGNTVIASQMAAEQASDSVNEVEELDSSSTWVAPAASKPRWGLNMVSSIR